VPDKILFVGDNAAHVYYQLVIILSTNNEIRDFSWISIDMPVLGDASELAKPANEVAYFPQFAVGDIDGNGKPELFIGMDDSGHTIPDKWKKR
jgi:hypothetical protein